MSSNFKPHTCRNFLVSFGLMFAACLVSFSVKAADVTINSGTTVTTTQDLQTNSTLTNDGTISGFLAVANNNSANNAVLINNGSIIGNLIGVFNGSGTNLTIINNASGTISSTFFAGVFTNNQPISTLTNYGVITGDVSSAAGIVIYTGLTTLNNAQGGNSSTAAKTALTYNGVIPTNYNIIINSPTHYGQLAVNNSATVSSGNTSFGISSLSAGSSVVSGTAYTSVLSGITNTQLGTSGTTISGTSNNYTYTLSRTDAVNNIWDLIVSGFSGGGASSTYRSNTISYQKGYVSNAAGMLDSLYNNTAMAGVMTALDGLTGAAQAAAISQTLPVITGAASQATTGAMQALNQIVQGRSNSLRGMASGDEYIGNRDMWMKGFGSWANQADVNGVSGYKINTGGLAIGVDQGFTPKLNIGAVLALSNSGVSSNSNSAPSGVTINSYQVGVYGDYAIEKNIIANAQADIGMNQNKEYRNITFMGTNANGTYNSYSAHLGTGVKYLMPIDMENTFIPSVRVDYTTVQSQAYSESGAGALNLSVAKQTYNTLIPSADVRIDHSLDSKMTLSGNAGAGYNTLNNQVSATSAYAGGGTTFATNGLQVSPWLYNAGVGVTGQIDKNLQLNVRYDNVFSPTGYMNQMVSAKLKIPL
jgi:outer membrane autotransporter protein